MDRTAVGTLLALVATGSTAFAGGLLDVGFDEVTFSAPMQLDNP